MDQAKREQLTFDQVIHRLHQATGRYEASFASKLIATLHPSKPIIDSVVLRNLKLRLPLPGSHDRAAKIDALHQQLGNLFVAFSQTKQGQYLKAQFNLAYPKTDITDEKKIDFVLWQTRI
jgi:hypothetical protein